MKEETVQGMNCKIAFNPSGGKESNPSEDWSRSTREKS